MTFPAYPAYKDSGVEWLGGVPEHWAVHPLKRAIERIESGTSVNAADLPAESGSLGVLKTSCVYTGKFDWAENKTVDDEDLSRVSCPLRKDTLIVSRMNTPDLVGATGLVTEAPNGIFLPDRLWQVYFLANHSPEFIFYFTKSREYREQVKMACSGTSASMQNLGQDDFRGLLFAEPPKPEQTQIAHFLDHEVARIDALIEEQQRLIELLKEKRQAVISHAVTKGLDPTVPMKNSGVEWLGEVPAHWGVKSMKHLVEDGESVSYGIVQPGDHQDEGVPFIQTTNMSSGDFSFDALQRTSSEIEANYPRSRLHGGEVILGIRATIGAAFVVPESLKNINLSRGVARIACSEQVLAGYLVYFLSGRAAFEYWGLAKQGSTFSEVSIATVRELPVTVPPLIEQQELIEHMEQGIKSLDELTLIGERTMALLRERRSALISAAVTGKIDVRGWQPPANAPTPELVEEAV